MTAGTERHAPETASGAADEGRNGMPEEGKV
jgi:hypothetical protein